MYRSYSPTAFINVKSLVAEGLSDYEIAAELDIPRSTVQNWRLRDNPPHALRAVAVVPRPVDEEAYAYLLGIYLGDGHVVRGRLDIYLDAEYEGVINEVVDAIGRAYPSSRTRMDSRPGATRVVASGIDWPTAFPQHGPGKKHERKIELELWQLEITSIHTKPFLRGLIHSDGCRCTNDFSVKLPSGRVGRYSYPRYFFSNLSADIREIFAVHCDLLGIRWTQSNPRNLSISHRKSVGLLDSFVGPKT